MSSPHGPPARLACIIGLVLQQGEVSHDGGERLAEGHTRRPWHSRDAEPGSYGKYSVQSTLLALCCSLELLELIKEWMGKKIRFGSLFFIQKKANYFSQGLLAAALTLSPQRIFWMFFLVCSAEFCVEGRGEAGELQSSLGRD